jgi:hypothetical protein
MVVPNAERRDDNSVDNANRDWIETVIGKQNPQTLNRYI